MARWGNQMTIVDEKNGGAFFGVAKFGPIDQEFNGRQTDTFVYRFNLADEILKVVFVGKVLGDDGLIVRLDN